MNKFYIECLRCYRVFSVVSERLPDRCDLCGSGDVRLIRTEKYEEEKIDLKRDYERSNRIFKKAYRKAFDEAV